MPQTIDNRSHKLVKIDEHPDHSAIFALDYSTHDEHTGKLLGITHFEGTLISLISKVVRAHREALFLGGRANRKIDILESQLKQATEVGITPEKIPANSQAQ